MTHEDLRKRAVRWLTTTKRCTVVLSEIVTCAGEAPDAIGWRYGESILVECKVSRADFHANAQKPHERAGRGVGAYRYFMTPENLVQPGDLVEIGPDEYKESDWGLIWAGEHNRVRVVKEAQRRTTVARGEIDMLVSALRRVRAREFLVIVPEASPVELEMKP